MKTVFISGAFEQIGAPQIRFIEEAGRLGELHALLWSDQTVQAIEGKPPKFPQEEREYFVQAIRYVRRLTIVDAPRDRDSLPVADAGPGTIWAVPAAEASDAKRQFCAARGIEYRVIPADICDSYPPAPLAQSISAPGRKKVLVTGCYDWFHTGHVRFFEECSELGDLYVVVGHDANIELLKGPGHPLFKEAQRRYIAGSIRYVKMALVSTGNGWLDAEPEIQAIRPDMYAVNEDGDKPEKRQYCDKTGIEYVVLKRLPRPGLQRRTSTNLRGF